MLKLYLSSLISFLIYICTIISIETYKSYKNYHKLFYNNKNNHNVKNTNQILNLAEIYIQQKQWLSCILLLESSYLKDKHSNYLYYGAIGFCYYKIKSFDLAEYYYSKAIRANPQNIESLFNIAHIYKLKNEITQAIKMYEAILNIDNKNINAQKQVNKLIIDKNRDSRI